MGIFLLHQHGKILDNSTGKSWFTLWVAFGDFYCIGKNKNKRDCANCQMQTN